MEFLIIKTGMPFGYLIIMAIFIIFSMISLLSAISAAKSKPIKKLKLTISLLVIFFLVLVYWANANQDEININPLIRDNEPLVGIWQNGTSQLVLLDDGQYSCSGPLCSSINNAGHWQRYQDFEIDLMPTANTLVRWRITQNMTQSSYQLISGAVGDPDFWKTHVTFQKTINIIRFAQDPGPG